jgi:tetratricopeptide (TPR) repeat protein
MTEATRLLDEAIAQAGDPRNRARARVEREMVRLETDTGVQFAHAGRVADAALPLLDGDGDEGAQSRVWSLRAQVAWLAGRVAQADEAWCEAADCARRAGDDRGLFEVVGWRATAAVLGPAPVQEAIERCETFREIVAGSPVAEAWTINPLAALHAMRGDVELAEALLAQANETLRQLGSLGSSPRHLEALVWLLAGRPQLAERPLREGVQRLRSMSAGGLLATTAAMLAQAVYAQDGLEEAGELCRTAAGSAAADDIVTQVIWRGVQAKVLARGGDRERAEALAREAVALAEPTDLLCHHADAMLDLAEVLRTCSRADESLGVVRAALSLYELKGNAVSAARARALLGD